MASKKRKAGVYIDRTQILSDSLKLPNVLDKTKAVACETNKHCSLEKRFKNKLVVEGDDEILDAMVLNNDICVLMSKIPLKVNSVAFSDVINTDNISGKQKKGAQTIKAGYVVCTVETIDRGPVKLKTPVGGKLLEFNDALQRDPSLLDVQYNGKGFIAVIYPNTEIPSLEGCPDYESMVERITNKHSKLNGGAGGGGNKCFSFAKGTCARGDKCKFKHELE
jgi:glycine cleavage system H lipoate-binding protein